ncbi:hypothetical protein [uncultured Lactobacillus sp.]|uniref:hypothetical protein n=1 Tax=uncultured Lactobacillus sp. TaxID=153152 RepID=UPI00262BC5F5|nr:hypothetical protein [uncultured Lactobacillus sp.]
MRINIKALPKEKLLHLFDVAARSKNEVLAGRVVNELADRNHISIEDQIRKLGQKASDEKNLASFQMASKLWEVV